uniref:Uncharacterized protein n=1 Tax=Anguilla anguilla TaxID=7936 RepID=A0A0E9U7Y9_ANGAN
MTCTSKHCTAFQNPHIWGEQLKRKKKFSCINVQTDFPAT